MRSGASCILLNDDLSVHLIETETYQIRGLTLTGRFHVEHLHLNRSPLVAYRRRQSELRLLRQEVYDMRERQERLAEEVEQLWHWLEEQHSSEFP